MSCTWCEIRRRSAAVLALLLCLLLAGGCERNEGGQEMGNTVEYPERGITGRPGPEASPAAPLPRPGLIEVTLREYEILMPETIAAGETTFNIRNTGSLLHGFRIEGPDVNAGLSEPLAPGDSHLLEVTLTPGVYQVYCPVSNHRARDMRKQITVEPGPLRPLTPASGRRSSDPLQPSSVP